MECNSLNNKRNNTKSYLLVFLGLIIIVPIIWILIDRMEGEKPQLKFMLQSNFIGKSLNLPVILKDQKSGLQRFWVALIKDGREYPIISKNFDFAGLLTGGLVNTKTIKIQFSPKNLGVSDGKALLRMAVWDYSWRKLGKGNQTYMEQEVLIDTQSAQIDVLSRAHNLNQGGSGLAIYRLSEPCSKSGVLVGDRFFPGHSGYFSDTQIYMAFFALTHKQGPKTKLVMTAVDNAGNESMSNFTHHINARRFRKDKIIISDRFVERKKPEFVQEISNGDKLSPLEIFLLVNEDVRKANSKTIFDIASTTEPKIYWKNEFSRLPNSANRARFADHRSYVYKGKVIDAAYHMGIDLASIARSPIPAANRGKVVFVGQIGIYGNTVIIDHGFGLLSLYGHMSSINVDRDQLVTKGDIIGKTGSSGLAGGDHLHFGMLVHNTYVNPIEWWDGTWIKNNITDKIADVKAR
jgi:murein DD-endopeptidase MepM/ murein hydrolase activator NlpD